MTVFFKPEQLETQSVVRRPFAYRKPQVILTGKLAEYTDELVVWWRGALTPNRRVNTVPLVNVTFRRVDAEGRLGAFCTIPIGLTYLNFLQVGTVWKQGKPASDTEMDLLPETALDFTPSRWRFVTADEAGLTRWDSPYQLPFDQQTWLLDFPMANGQNILIPCIEILVKLYGRSSEISRILTTYPWEEVQKRFFFDSDLTWDTNVIKLHRWISNSEAAFLAHLRHNPRTAYLCQKLHSDLEAAFQGSRFLDSPFGDLQVAPWFTGPATIRGMGHWLNDGKTFLCLRLTGASEPDEQEKLEIHRPDYSTEDRPRGDDDDDPFIKRLTKTVSFDQQAQLTSDQEPGSDFGTHVLLNESFEVLGKRRETVTVTQRKPGNRGKRVLPAGDADVLSSGDPGGTGSGVAKGEVVDTPTWESMGVLADVWFAVEALKARHPSVIEKSEWFTLEARGAKPPATLVLLKPFEPEDEVEQKTRNWIFLNRKNNIVRGVQILRIVCAGRVFFLFEIQRRPILSQNDESEAREQKAQAFLIELSGSWSEVSTQIRTVLNLIRHHRGVFRNFAGVFRTANVPFNHSKNAADKILYETCIRKNLEKLGVDFGRVDEGHI
ncbi:hypothetical protein V2J82_10080 [Pseudomonas alliivorans]|nr:hypothetical protein [Pseudomonas alliivorans]